MTREQKEPVCICWITRESLWRLIGGGNDSRGTVPVHFRMSAAACIPLYRLPTRKEKKT